MKELVPGRTSSLTAYHLDMADHDLRAVFAASWGRVPPVALGPILTDLCVQARAAHPGLALEDRDLVAAVAVHAPIDDVEGFCGRCRAADFALAVAAGAGSAPAILELERVHAATIDATCRRFAGRGYEADDLRQLLRAKLFVAEGTTAPRIAAYNGQGSLGSWLRVIATRLFIDLGRRKDRAREASEDPDELAVVDPFDLELELVKTEYRGAVAAAMVEAARELEPGERHLLRQHLAAGLTIDQLAAVLGIHRATVARRIARARDILATRTRELVSTKLQLDDRELGELLGLVVSKIDVSLRKLLATRPP